MSVWLRQEVQKVLWCIDATQIKSDPRITLNVVFVFIRVVSWIGSPFSLHQVLRRNEIDYDLSACVALFQITNSFGRFTQAVTPVDYWRSLPPRGRRSRWRAAPHFISSLTAFTQPLSRQRMRRAARMCDWEAASLPFGNI